MKTMYQRGFLRAMEKLRYDGVISKTQRREIEGIFHGHMSEAGRESGVSEKELEVALAYLSEKAYSLDLEKKDIETMREVFTSYMS